PRESGGPQSADYGFVLGQDRHGRVVAVQTLAGEPVTADQFDERRQARGASADPVRQGRHVELDAFPGKRFALPVERLMLAKLGVKGSSPTSSPQPARGR